MESTANYKRSFIILDEQSKEFRGGSGKAATGYAKIEDMGNKTRIGLYVQNVVAGSYLVHCICVKDNNVGVIECGNLTVGVDNKADISFESNPNKLFNSDFRVNDVVGVSVSSHKGIVTLDGFKSNKFRYAISPQKGEGEAAEVNENIVGLQDESNENIKARENNIEEGIEEKEAPREIPIGENKDVHEVKEEKTNDQKEEVGHANNQDVHKEEEKAIKNDENEKTDKKEDTESENNDENVNVKSENEEQEIPGNEEKIKEKDAKEEKSDKCEEDNDEMQCRPMKSDASKEELKTGIGPKNNYSENLDTMYIPFENASIHFKWIKKTIISPGLSEENHYVRKIMMLPNIYQMCAVFGHYVVGMGEEHVIIGVPGKYKDTYRYMEKYSNICEWVKMSETMWDYGYWLFYLDKGNASIVYID